MTDPAYSATPRSTATRYRDRVSYDRAAVHAVLDEATHCHLGFVADGAPRVLPTLHVRVGDVLYVHGSTGSRPMRDARGGLPVCVTVTLLDALVLARSHFHHSANYRSVMAHGTARPVDDPAEKRAALSALVDKLAAGRAGDSRPPTGRELAQTTVLALPLVEVSLKVRACGANEEPEDLDLPYWSGHVPVRTVRGEPVPEPGTTLPVPGYLRAGMPARADAPLVAAGTRSPWLEPAVLRGRHVILEPLEPAHAAPLFTACDDEDVHRWMMHDRPAGTGDIEALVGAALAAHARGARVPWVQRDARTGEVVGTTSYYAVDPDNRSLAIGYTMLGRPWWRTGVNTEAKLLLLSRAFDDLGAVRVELHTHAGNERSQRAIERLGARREGLLRRHKRMANGAWRDTVQYAIVDDDWPGVRANLRERLSRGAVTVSN